MTNDLLCEWPHMKHKLSLNSTEHFSCSHNLFSMESKANLKCGTGKTWPNTSPLQIPASYDLSLTCEPFGKLINIGFFNKHK